MEIVKKECSSCGGTGIYHGFAESEGLGVVCLDCEGTGCGEIQYIPFTKRKMRNDIKRVSLSRGKFIFAAVGPVEGSVPYQDFLDGKISYRKE